MTMVERVAKAVLEKSRATLHDLEQLLPDASRPQIQKALENAKRRGLLRIAVQGNGGKHPRPTVWAAPAQARPITSVWDLGAQREEARE